MITYHQVSSSKITVLLLTKFYDTVVPLAKILLNMKH